MMKHCVLLDPMTSTARIVRVDDKADVMITLYNLIDCDMVQLLPVYPGRLQNGFAVLVDEDTYGKPNVFNPLASWLYGCDDHGQPIFRGAVIMKDTQNDLAFLTKDEAEKIVEDINTRGGNVYVYTLMISKILNQ